MRKIILLLTFCFSSSIFAQADKIVVENGNSGHRLKVNGKNFMVKGMNWDYYPIGTNYNYSLWKQSDDVIITALDAEMSLLKNMGVNTVRQYTGVPAKWIKYIYEKYGIYTMLNHSFGRYGLTIDGTWVANTEYSDKRTQELLLSEVKSMVTEYKNTPGILLFLLGNENNYGLFWDGAETEDIPIQKWISSKRISVKTKPQTKLEKLKLQFGMRHTESSGWLKITHVLDGGLAAAAGLAAGDLLGSINGQRVTNARWDKVLGSLHEGQSMSICFYRDDLMHERMAFLEASQMPAQYELSPTNKPTSI